MALSLSSGNTPLMSIPHDEREITDRDLFEALDLSWHGLEATAAAWRAGDVSAARRALVDYFRTRQKPAWHYDLRGASADTIRRDAARNFGFYEMFPTGPDMLKETVRMADAFLENRFVLLGESYELDFGPDLAWHIPELIQHNCTSAVFKRLAFLMHLAVAYLLKGNPAYLEKYSELLDRYLTEWPLVWEHRGPGAYRVQNRPTQEAMSTAFRTCAWQSLLYTDVPYDDRVPVDLTFRMIRSLWFTAWQYRRFDTDTFTHNNHHLWERGISPFRFALMLPEFPELRPMLDRGRAVGTEHAMRDFFDDGGYNEHTLPYTANMTLGIFAAASRLAARNDTWFLNAEAKQRIKKCFEAIASLTQPDGHLPPLGDAWELSAKTTLADGRDVFGSRVCDAVLQALELNGGAVAATKEAPLPALAVRYPDGGYIVGRDAWSPEADYFIMCANTRGVMGHDHQDMLSLIIAASGETIIGEPPAPLFNLTNTGKYKGSALRGYLYNMTSHNTVLAYGRPIRDDIFFGSNWGGFPAPVKVLDFAPAERHLYVRAAHDGYTCSRHQREVLFVHGTGWLILDRIIQGPSLEMPHVQRWHFERGTAIRNPDSHSVLATKGKAGLLCVWPETPEVCLEAHEDTAINVGAFHDGMKPSWILDVSFPGTGKARLPCVFLVASGAVSTEVLAKCRNRLLTGLAENDIEPERDAGKMNGILDS